MKPMDLNIFHFTFCFVFSLSVCPPIPKYDTLLMLQAGKKVTHIHSFKNYLLNGYCRVWARRGQGPLLPWCWPEGGSRTWIQHITQCPAFREALQIISELTIQGSELYTRCPGLRDRCFQEDQSRGRETGFKLIFQAFLRKLGKQ